MITCLSCHKDILIKLMPDYASSGMWCGHCGIGYSNPKDDFPLIPDGLVVLVYGWNWFWESAMNEKNNINKQHFVETFRTMGKELAKQINEFYPCVYADLPVFY
jgi:hypothetical protein